MDTQIAFRVRVSVWAARCVQCGDPKSRHVVRLQRVALRHGRPRRDSNSGRENARESSGVHQGSHDEKAMAGRSRTKFPAKAAGYKKTAPASQTFTQLLRRPLPLFLLRRPLHLHRHAAHPTCHIGQVLPRRPGQDGVS